MARVIGTVVEGRYEIVRRIGEGGMGEVYEARHVEIGKRVAIKVLSVDYADDEQTLRRFHQEAEIAAGLSHENICAVTDFGRTEDGRPYIVMELLEGESLADLLRREGRMTLVRALSILHQVLGAVGEAHSRGIVHRDLKPENVFLASRPKGEVIKLLDFGISKILLEGEGRLDLTKTGAMVGTAFYMSPEQVRGLREVDHRTDIYACGVMLYEMLTGRRPFEGKSVNEVMFKIVEGPFPMPGEDDDVPLPALKLVMKAMARDPSARHSDAAQMRSQVEDLIGKAVTEQMPPAPRAGLERGKWRRISLMVLVPAIVILLSLGAVLYWMTRTAGDGIPAYPALFAFPDDGKWGFLDSRGNVAIHALFDNAGDFSEGCARVLVGQKWGFVDSRGTVVIQPAYEQAGDFHEALARVRLDGKWGFVDRRGKLVVSAIYDGAGDFSGGLSAVLAGEKWGYVDARGRIRIAPALLAAGPFREGLAAAACDRGWGHIDEDGRFAVLPDYWFAGEFHDGLARVKVCEGGESDFCRWGFVDPEGKRAISPRFDWAYDFSEGLALVMSEGKWGYVGRSGHFEILPRFANAASFSDGLARVKMGGRWGFVDRTGRWAIEPRFYLVGDFAGPLAGATYIDALPEGGAPPATDSGYIDRTGRFVWNGPAKDLSAEVPPDQRMMWNFDFDTGDIRVIGSFDPTTYEIKFRDDKGAFTTIPLDLPHPLELGSVRTVFPAENYTLVLTDNYMALTLGWAALIGGETSLVKTRVGGSEFVTNVAATKLTEDSRGPNLLAWAVGKNRLYLLARSGKIKHRAVDDLYAALDEFILAEEPSPLTVLHYRDGLVYVFRPGTTYAVIPDEAGPEIHITEKDLGFTATEIAKVEDLPGAIVVTFGDRKLEIPLGDTPR